MTLTHSIALFLAFLQAPVSLFEVDLWPGEGRPVFEAVSRSLELREVPLVSSKIIGTVTVSPRRRLSFDNTRYRTIQAGNVRVLASTRVTGRMLGSVSRLSREDYYKGKFTTASVDVRPGMSVEFLQYRAEGTCFVRIAGNVIEADSCPANDKSKFRVETEPKTEWWIHIVFPGGSAGWLLVTDSSAKVVNREF
jgi:hypothetical protein